MYFPQTWPLEGRRGQGEVAAAVSQQAHCLLSDISVHVNPDLFHSLILIFAEEKLNLHFNHKAKIQLLNIIRTLKYIFLSFSCH